VIDYSANSNYTELALRELGVNAFPHVGKRTEIDVRGKKIFPIVTGTFGMTDFLHSVVGELGDKVAQSEVEDMESKLTSASEKDDQNDQTSILKEILDKVPWDMLEGDGDAKPDPAKADELKQAAARKAEEAKEHPLDPNLTLGGVNIEEAKQTAEQTLKDMYPILEFHDQIMKAMTTIMSKVPGLDDLLENMSGALQIFIFSLLSPYVKPIIAQARLELKSTSQGVLKSSEKGQYEVFNNENCSDPTHSMLSKDHFSNVLNPVAGQVACATVKFVVPHIVDAWSDNGKDVRQVIDDILQVFHHPALRDENREGQKAMFETVRSWWEGKDESEKQHLEEILSFDGVKDGKNHEGEGAEGGHGHSHGAPVKKKNEEIALCLLLRRARGFFLRLRGRLLILLWRRRGCIKNWVQVVVSNARTTVGRMRAHLTVEDASRTRVLLTVAKKSSRMARRRAVVLRMDAITRTKPYPMAAATTQRRLRTVAAMTTKAAPTAVPLKPNLPMVRRQVAAPHTVATMRTRPHLTATATRMKEVPMVVPLRASLTVEIARTKLPPAEEIMITKHPLTGEIPFKTSPPTVEPPRTNLPMATTTTTRLLHTAKTPATARIASALIAGVKTFTVKSQTRLLHMVVVDVLKSRRLLTLVVALVEVSNLVMVVIVRRGRRVDMEAMRDPVGTRSLATVVVRTARKVGMEAVIKVKVKKDMKIVDIRERRSLDIDLRENFEVRLFWSS
jgi:hypothetical protein